MTIFGRNHRFRSSSLLALALVMTVAMLLQASCVSLTPYCAVRQTLPDSDLLRVDGETVHVVDRGEGEAVVLLHGFGASAWSWREVTPRLVGYRTVAIDLFGFGATERTERLEAYTRQGQVAMVLGVMDALGIERAHLVGHSYGGSLAQTFAARHPDRLRSLVLVNAARADYPQQRRNPLAAVGPLNSLFLRTVGLRDSSVRDALENSVADDAVVTDELVEGYRSRLAVEGAGRAYKGLTRPGADPGPPVDLAAIAVPTLAVWGDEDSLIPVGGARQRIEEIPDSRFVSFPDIGHLPMEEAPEKLAAEIRLFLDEVIRGR